MTALLAAAAQRRQGHGERRCRGPALARSLRCWAAGSAAYWLLDLWLTRHGTSPAGSDIRAAPLSILAIGLLVLVGATWPVGSSVGLSIACSAGPSACSTRLRRGHRRLHRASSACCCASASGAAGLRRPAGADLFRLHPARPRASSPRRTRAICWSTCNCPTPPPSQRTQDVVKQIEEIALKTPASSTPSPSPANRFLLNANAPNFGAMYVMLDDFQHRTGRRSGRRRHRRPLAGSALQQESARRSVNVFGAPPLEGLGTAGGFKIMVEDRGDTGLAALQETADKHRRRRRAARPGLQDLFTSFRANTPWLYLTSTASQAKAMGVSMGELFNTLQVVPRLVLRQRLQPLRPHLASERPGRRQLSAQQIDDLKQLKSATTAARWCRWQPWPRCEDDTGPVADHALQHVSRRGHQRHSRRPASAPARPSS